MMWNIIPYAYLLSVLRSLLRSLAHILIKLFAFLLLTFKSSLYISDNSPLLDMSFANIFFQYVAYLPILLILSFTVQKFFILM